MNDRWRLKNKVDPQMMATIPYIVKDDSGNVVRKYKELIFFRKSRLGTDLQKGQRDLDGRDWA